MFLSLHQPSFRAVYLALMMLVSLAALDATVVSVAVPTMIEDLGGARCADFDVQADNRSILTSATTQQTL